MIHLTLSSLLSDAETDTGLSDWGEGEFRENLTLLIEEVQNSNPLEHGIQQFHHRVQRVLRNRLKLVEDRKQDPAIAHQNVRAPLFVTGWPRSGSTFLHSLLAQDPDSRSPAEWEAWRPSPPPRAETYTTDQRIALAQAEMPTDPNYLKRHIQGAQLPIECGPACFIYEFVTNGFDIRWHLPRSRERLNKPIISAYQWHKRVLQHLQAHTRQSHWVLKSPEHIGHFRELFDVYPDARIINTHRDPAQVFPSLASLTAYMQEQHIGPVDHQRTGSEVVAFWGEQQRLATHFRISHPQLAQAFCDVIYSDLIADPMAVVKRIYNHHGMNLSVAAESNMAQWLEDYSQERYREAHGEHIYTAQEYGLNEESLQQHFHDYRQRYLI